MPFTGGGSSTPAETSTTIEIAVDGERFITTRAPDVEIDSNSPGNLDATLDIAFTL